jgi:tRNA (mo5U34)-methyltransferase
MLDLRAIFPDLAAAGLAEWQDPLRALLIENLRDGIHGKLEGWQSTLQNLPEILTDEPVLHEAAVRIPDRDCDTATRAELRNQLMRLTPWRKGPFDVCGIRIDSEWRSDLKWSRIAPAISPLQDRLVLDVGCGNGYYAMRMRGLGARCVLGVDPTLLFLVQFLAIQRYARLRCVHVLPLRLSDLPHGSRAFDTTFSMGVLYHQRDPLQHLQQLHGTLRPGGELILETLILPGDDRRTMTPPDRYARMRNVWQLPTLPMLRYWLETSGFGACNVADISVTTIEEQRTTEWMPFDSLAQALDPADERSTVEGWPRPRRALLVAQVPT